MGAHRARLNDPNIITFCIGKPTGYMGANVAVDCEYAHIYPIILALDLGT